MIQTIAIGFVFVAGAAAVTLLCYALMRGLAGAAPEPHTKDLAGSVVFRISALHGLILALVFAQEMVDYQQLRYESAIEANAIADVYFDADRYGGESEKKIQDAMFSYVGMVIGEEWRHLDETGRLLGKAWGAWDAAYTAILDLTPANDRERSLRDHMLVQIHAIAEARVKRENHGDNSVSMMFWFAAVAGVIFIALAYYTFPPNRVNLTLISLFGGFTGLILFFIYAFENPYGSPGVQRPAAYERLLAQIEDSRSR
ncbi:MAG: hypothetical protein KDK89_15890 [Alphaproteobacteria bacterium]|nr:hypothetical protein [Alphaproteobacteria bacterium]